MFIYSKERLMLVVLFFEQTRLVLRGPQGLTISAPALLLLLTYLHFNVTVWQTSIRVLPLFAGLLDRLLDCVVVG